MTASREMINVRHSTPEDADGIAEVNASATATLRQTYRPNRKALAHKRRISRELSRLVAVLEGRIVGTTQYYVDGDALRIIGLGVLSTCRRKGVARALVARIRDIACQWGLHSVVTSTVKETGNVPVFEKLGFGVVSEKPDEYSESDTHPQLTDVELRMDLA